MVPTWTSHMSRSHSMPPLHVVIGPHVGEGECVQMCLCLNSLSCSAVTSCLQTELEVSQVYFFIKKSESQRCSISFVIQKQKLKEIQSMDYYVINIDPLNISMRLQRLMKQHSKVIGLGKILKIFPATTPYNNIKLWS